MNKKSLLIGLLLLFSIHNVSLNTGAVDIYRVSGYVTINDAPAPADVDVKLSFSDGDEIRDTSATGYYSITWDAEVEGHVLKSGSFSVYYSGEWYTPIDNGSVFIQLSPIAYEINLAVDTDIDPLENEPPIASDDAYTTEEDQPLTIPDIGVLSNDNDPDSGPQPLKAYLETSVTHGTLLLTETGGFTYTPEENYAGPDSFTYKAFDGQSYSNVATVTITITAVDDVFSPPTNPDPSDGATQIALTQTLSWDSSDPDNEDEVNYSVYFGPTTSPPLKSENQSGLSYAPSSLSYDTIYYWYVVAWKDDSALASSLWMFTTKPQGSSGSSSSSSSSSSEGSEENTPPTADASLSDTTGVVNVPLIFNGSLSTDDTGIESYYWDFDDGTNGTGVTITHSFLSSGTYQVTLTVFDDEGLSDNDEVIVTIGQENYPPTTPIITGPTLGNISITYTYTMQSMDQDDEHIRYIIDWGDGSSDTTGLYNQSTPVEQQHIWTTPGRYTLVITADDNHTESSPASLMVYINARPLGSLGYLVDTDADGVYDIYIDDEGNEYMISLHDIGYIFDSDGDGIPDSFIDIETGLITEYSEQEVIPQGDDTTLVLLIGGVLIIIAVAGIIYFFSSKPKNK